MNLAFLGNLHHYLLIIIISLDLLLLKDLLLFSNTRLLFLASMKQLNLEETRMEWNNNEGVRVIEATAKNGTNYLRIKGSNGSIICVFPVRI